MKTMKDCRKCKYFVDGDCINTDSNNYYNPTEPTPHKLLDLPDDKFFAKLASDCKQYEIK